MSRPPRGRGRCEAEGEYRDDETYNPMGDTVDFDEDYGSDEELMSSSSGEGSARAGDGGAAFRGDYRGLPLDVVGDMGASGLGPFWGARVCGRLSRWDLMVILLTFGIQWRRARADLEGLPWRGWDYAGLLFFGPFWVGGIRDRPGCEPLWTRDNVAIPLNYCLVGIFQGLSSAAMNYYPLQINATEAQQTTIKTLRALPASFKIFFGFLSDTLPIGGYRRKVYMAIGWAVAALAAFSLAVADAPSVPFLSLTYTLYGTGFWLADVMGDSLVAEKAQQEPEGHRGNLQSVCYACRFYWLMVSVCIAIGAYESFKPLAVFWVLAVLPIIVMAPAILLLRERRNVAVAPVREQARTIWATVCNRSVWQPMAFVYIFNVLQIGNAAWNQFLVSAKGFTSLETNSFLVPGYIMLFAGIAAYKAYMIDWSWRVVYLLTTFLGAVFSALQFALIFGWNKRYLGIGDYPFALGDDVFVEFLGGVQFLPTTIMMVNLCPKGSEGASYAMFTTVNNCALQIGSTVSSLLVNIWDTDEETLAAQDMSGMWRLTLLTSCLQLSAILFLPLLPRNEEALRDIGKGGRPSAAGGAIFLAVVVLSLLWSLVVAVLNILEPGWL